MTYEEYVKLQKEGSDWSKDSAWGSQMEESIRQIFEDLPRDRSVLDIGCGEGRGIAALKDMGFEDLAGIDINDEKTASPHYQVQDCLTCGDFHELPWEDRSFDYTFSSHALEHALDLTKAIKEMIRVTKLRGFIIVPLHKDRDLAEVTPHTSEVMTMEQWTDIFDECDISWCHHEVKDRLGKEIWTEFQV